MKLVALNSSAGRWLRCSMRAARAAGALAGVMSAVVWGAVGTAGGLPMAADSPEPVRVIAAIEGETITQAEFEAELPQHRAKVAGEFAPQGKEFDDTAVYGEAATVLRERTMAALKRLVVERALFRRHGVRFPADFAAVVAGCERENQRRSVAVAQGGVVFGPKHFSVLAWRGYLHSTARMELMRRLVASREIVVADAEVEARFQALQAAGTIRAEATLEECRAALRVQLVDERYLGLVDERVRVAGGGLTESGTR